MSAWVPLHHSGLEITEIKVFKKNILKYFVITVHQLFTFNWMECLCKRQMMHWSVTMSRPVTTKK